MNYTQTGTYLTVAGIIVALLAHIGWVLQPSDVAQVIGAVVALCGAITQAIAHRKLAVAAGAVKPKS